MKKIIVGPDKYFSGFVTDFYTFLYKIFKNLISELNLVNTSNLKIDDSIDFVIVASIAHWKNEELRELKKIKKNAKLICWHDDFFWIDEESRMLNEWIFDRADLIIYGSKSVFLDVWGQYEKKSSWLPFFAGCHYHQEYNRNPIYKCVLSGKCTEKQYPLRNQIKLYNSNFIEKLNHPGYHIQKKESVVYENYSKYLNKYFCSVSDSGKSYGTFKYKITGEERFFEKNIDEYLIEKMGNSKIDAFKKKGQLLLKYFEIPASGSLLIADEDISDIFELGYKPDVNFVAINSKNALSIIEDCCLNPDKYEKIRYQGWLHSMNHTIEQREKTLKKILTTFKIETKY